MDKFIHEFYKGYEGEPEIQFIKDSKEGERTILSIWGGFFDDIMRQFEPTDSGWQGIAYYYHMCIGWVDNRLWEIPNLSEALADFQSLDASNLIFNKSSDVLFEICKLLADATNNHEKVLIVAD